MSRTVTLTFAALIAALAQTPARADGVGVLNCGGGRGSAGCTLMYRDSIGNPNVRGVPQPKGDQDKAESAQRERLWVARCRPRMTVDDFGVQRYVYAAAGCDFGKYQ